MTLAAVIPAKHSRNPNDVLAPGGMLYVTEVHTKHASITPLHGFGLTMPEALYSIAYF